MMKMYLSPLLFLSLFLPLWSQAGLQGEVQVEEYLLLTTAKEPAAPLLIRGKILFRIKPERDHHSISILPKDGNLNEAFALQKNQFGLFIGLYPIPSEFQEDIFLYRVIIDGLYQKDLSNPSSITTDELLTFSSLTLNLSSQTDSLSLSPVIRDSAAFFYYRGEPNQEIFLVGSFNHWDPYLTSMREVSPGYYERRLRLPAGTYQYRIRVGQEEISDPRNERWSWVDPQTNYSVFQIP